MNTPLPSKAAVAVAVLRKYSLLVDARSFHEAASIMDKVIAPEIAEYLTALDGCSRQGMAGELINWLDELASAIVCAEVPALKAA